MKLSAKPKYHPLDKNQPYDYWKTQNQPNRVLDAISLILVGIVLFALAMWPR